MVEICEACDSSAISRILFHVPGATCSYSLTACGGGNGALQNWICCNPAPVTGAYGNVIGSGREHKAVCPLSFTDVSAVSRGPVVEVGDACGVRLVFVGG